MSYYSAVDAFYTYTHGTNHFTTTDLLRFAGVRRNNLSDGFIDIHKRTLTRWLETNSMPLIAVRALQYRAGDLSEIQGGHFRRWRIVDDLLYDQNNTEYSKADILNTYNIKYELSETRHELERTKLELAELKAHDRDHVKNKLYDLQLHNLELQHQNDVLRVKLGEQEKDSERQNTAIDEAVNVTRFP